MAYEKSIWSGAISFGLINIPVQVMSAKEEERLSFHMLDRRDNSPIGYKQINKNTGKEVTRKNIVKAYEYEPHQFVTLEKEDFIKANPKSTQTIDIENFVDLEDVDFLLFEKPYYLVPQKNGKKGYLLLRKTLESLGKAAIAKVVIRTKEHLVAIIAKGDYLILETLRFAHEIQEVHEAKFLDEEDLDKIKINKKELEMARELVSNLTGPWEPEKYEDTYQKDLLRYIRHKMKTGDTEFSEPVEEPAAPSNVTDLLPLLRKSLEGKKKAAPHKRKSGREAHA
jgi:DNA end-binding protein Ku